MGNKPRFIKLNLCPVFHADIVITTYKVKNLSACFCTLQIRVSNKNRNMKSEEVS